MAKSELRQPRRYHPLLAGLHWVLAVLIVTNLAGGWLLTQSPSPADSAKLGALRIHVAVGLTVLVLTLVRLGARLRTRRPPPVQAAPVLRWSASVVHWGFYGRVLAMASSGLGLAQMSGLFEAFKGDRPLPQHLERFPPFAGHALFAEVLIAFIAVHLAAAVFHQFVRRDGLLDRMSLARRAPSDR